MKFVTFRCDPPTFKYLAELAKLNPQLYRNRSQAIRIGVQALITKARSGKDWKRAGR